MRSAYDVSAACGSAGKRLPTSDWRQSMGERRRRHLQVWFGSGAALTFLIIVIGGITRLTQSGLSIVDWNPIMGVIPPIGEAEWEAAFTRYRQYPEYQLLRPDMTLPEFRSIFYWEYVHRLAARLIGVVFLVPFAYFLTRGYFTRPLLLRALALFGLGALQGFMGWYMVSSGLLDDPRVSHYRLAAHLFIALCIFGLCLWMVRELSVRRDHGARLHPRGWRLHGLLVLGGLLLMQIVWGAFVAGLDAGLYYSTFPLMGGELLPPGGAMLDPLFRNALENPIAVQWVHRVLGTLLAAAALAAWVAGRHDGDLVRRRLSLLFLALVLGQYGLGVATLLLHVPVSLGALHQALAVVVFAIWLVWLHRVRGSNAAAGASASA